ncbi:MAG TPA: Crp/Fnr family transcriptional regulator [Thermopetrobacter sp.]|nr:Crp/Fnr family transcriptional regulator [Thermopetrobacter sp.]
MRALKERLGGAVKTIDLKTGETLFRQGDAARGMYLLETGRVRLVRHTPDGHQVPLHTVSPGESFAEASLFASEYHCDCVCLAAARVTLLPSCEIIGLLRSGDDAGLALVGRLAAHVRDLRARAELRAIRDVRLRLLSALRMRMDAAGRVRLQGSLKALAAELGMAHETLYRALADLQRGGHLGRHDGLITIRKRD